jgi:hypothetical protein
MNYYYIQTMEYDCVTRHVLQVRPLLKINLCVLRNPYIHSRL